MSFLLLLMLFISFAGLVVSLLNASFFIEEKGELSRSFVRVFLADALFYVTSIVISFIFLFISPVPTSYEGVFFLIVTLINVLASYRLYKHFKGISTDGR